MITADLAIATASQVSVIGGELRQGPTSDTPIRLHKRPVKSENCCAGEEETGERFSADFDNRQVRDRKRKHFLKSPIQGS
jgi:hypothetical protein